MRYPGRSFEAGIVVATLPAAGAAPAVDGFPAERYHKDQYAQLKQQLRQQLGHRQLDQYQDPQPAPFKCCPTYLNSPGWTDTGHSDPFWGPCTAVAVGYSCLRDEHSSSCPPALFDHWIATSGGSRSTGSNLGQSNSGTTDSSSSSNSDCDGETDEEDHFKDQDEKHQRLGGTCRSEIRDHLLQSPIRDEPAPSCVSIHSSPGPLVPSAPGRRRPTMPTIPSSEAEYSPLAAFSAGQPPPPPPPLKVRGYHHSFSYTHTPAPDSTMRNTDSLTTLVGFLVLTKESSLLLGQLRDFLLGEPHFPGRRTSIILAIEGLIALLDEATRIYKTIKPQSIDPLLPPGLLQVLEAKVGLCSTDIQNLVKDTLQNHLRGSQLREADVYGIHSKVSGHSFQIQRAIAHLRMQSDELGLQSGNTTAAMSQRNSEASRPSWGVVLSGRLDSLEKSFQEFASSERESRDADTTHLTACINKVNETLRGLLSTQTEAVSSAAFDTEALENRLSSIDNSFTSLATSIEKLVDRIEKDNRYLRTRPSPQPSPLTSGQKMALEKTDGNRATNRGKSWPQDLGASKKKKEHIASHSPMFLTQDKGRPVPSPLALDKKSGGPAPSPSPLKLTSPKSRNSVEAKRSNKSLSSPLPYQIAESSVSSPKRKSIISSPMPTSKFSLRSRTTSASVSSTAPGRDSSNKDKGKEKEGKSGSQRTHLTGLGIKGIDVNKPLPSPMMRGQPATPIVTKLEPTTPRKRITSLPVASRAEQTRPASPPTRRDKEPSPKPPQAPPVPGPRNPDRLSSQAGGTSAAAAETAATSAATTGAPPIDPSEAFTHPLLRKSEKTRSPSPLQTNPSPQPSLKSPKPSVSLGLKRNTFSSRPLRLPRLGQLSSPSSASSPQSGGEKDSPTDADIKSLKAFSTSSPNLKAWQEMHNSSGLPGMRDLKEHLRIQEEWNYVIGTTSTGDKPKMGGASEESGKGGGGDEGGDETTPEGGSDEIGPKDSPAGSRSCCEQTDQGSGAGNLQPPAELTTNVIPPSASPAPSSIYDAQPPSDPPSAFLYRANTTATSGTAASKPRYTGDGRVKGYLPRRSEPNAGRIHAAPLVSATSTSATAGAASSPSSSPRKDTASQRGSVPRRLVNSLYSLGTNF
ncbi:hypothetical protein MKZ38_002062 [Zalerion maritima]|uniref:Uncharacterized protein n=1 Tax=Zalerion maritima TaxID=339359 RepID=A0AAD5WUW0_9PEZI|nr:hypothetical protein MKZ38_002062 [Zalerion maritima]